MPSGKADDPESKSPSRESLVIGLGQLLVGGSSSSSTPHSKAQRRYRGKSTRRVRFPAVTEFTVKFAVAEINPFIASSGIKCPGAE
jgi:hypothetical protein